MKKKLLAIAMTLVLMCGMIPSSMAAGVPSVKVILYPAASDATITGASTGSAKTKSGDPYNMYYSRAIGSDVAKRSGYTFLGWYLSIAGGAKVTSSTKMTSTTGSVYAHWAKNLSALTFNENGGTKTVTISGTGGHKWYVYNVTQTSLQISVRKKSDTSFDIVVGKRSDSSKSTYNATVNFKDGDGNMMSVSVSQTPNYANVRNRVNNTITTGGRFFNVCAAGAAATYNFKYSALFRGTNSITWCPDSAMLDLMNRRLAADSKLQSNFFFDIRDVLTGMAEKSNGKTGCISVSGATDIFVTVNKANANGEFSNGGGEWCNYTSGTYTKKFKNTYGSCGKTAANYDVVFEGVKSWSADKKISELVTLLDKHPEGVFIYSSANNSGKTSSHAMLVVGYTKTNGTYSFTYIDNGASLANSGCIPYSKTCFYSGHKVYNESEMLAKIYNIAYVK